MHTVVANFVLLVIHADRIPSDCACAALVQLLETVHALLIDFPTEDVDILSCRTS